ncbi:MAG: hypothetical protein AAF530_20065 [Pseudomonadota bacterium]
MTYENQNDRGNGGEKNQPTHIVKKREGYGKKATYERIGVAWENIEDGSLYVRVYGTQIISGGFTCYPIEER